jgi:hypothetical protein
MPAKKNLNRREFLCFGVAPVVSVVPVKTANPSINKTRRVVTGVDTEGKSGIISDDGALQVANHFESDKFQIRTLWLENRVPVDMTSNTETLEGYTFSFDPPKSGVIAIMVTCAPGYVGEHHRTQTIDFIFVISGLRGRYGDSAGNFTLVARCRQRNMQVCSGFGGCGQTRVTVWL